MCLLLAYSFHIFYPFLLVGYFITSYLHYVVMSRARYEIIILKRLLYYNLLKKVHSLLTYRVKCSYIFNTRRCINL